MTASLIYNTARNLPVNRFIPSVKGLNQPKYVPMLSYRHYFHAGNFADTLKHSVYCSLLRALQRKSSPIFVLDTHAGAGLYDLLDPMAAKGKEYDQGIAKLLVQSRPPSGVQLYLDAVRSVNPDPDRLRFYPGSPRIARQLLRPQDHLALCELHTTDIKLLATNFAGDQSVSVHHTDGYHALDALLPPIQRRGIVLIDPAFELQDEFDRLARAFQRAYFRWPTGIFAVWYPIRQRAVELRWLSQLVGKGIRKLLQIELSIRDCGNSDEECTRGCGIIIANSPWQFDVEMNVLVPWLWQSLAIERQGGWKVEWLVPE